jgi:hypothetical protein
MARSDQRSSYGKLRDAVEVDGVDGHGAAAAEAAQGFHDGVSRGCERHGRIQGRGRLAGRADARRSEARSLCLAASRTGPDVDLAAPVARDLERQQCRGTKSEETEPATRLDAADPQRAIADDAATEQGRRMQVVEGLRESKGEVCEHGHVAGESAVAVPSGKAGRGAQVLTVTGAEAAGPTGRSQPGGTGALADAPAADVPSDPFHTAHRLVAGHDGQLARGDLALHHLQVRPADRARRHPDDQLVGPWLGIGELDILEGARVDRGRHREPHGTHGATVPRP